MRDWKSENIINLDQQYGKWKHLLYDCGDNPSLGEDYNCTVAPTPDGGDVYHDTRDSSIQNIEMVEVLF